MVTDLVKLQERHGKDGLQVVGVTRFYGFGTDFPDGPKSGKAVGQKDGRLSEAAEIEINERYVEAFGINYPVAILPREVSSKLYSIFAIPAVFLIDRRGIVRCVATGPDHRKLDAEMSKALAEAPPDDSDKDE